jgi:hypothetical protein
MTLQESIMVSNKLLVAVAAMSTLGFSLSTMASSACNTGCPGVYVGAQGGWGQVKFKNGGHHEAGHRSNNNGDLGGRVYLGYQFSPFFGLETGVAGFFNSDSDHHHDDNTLGQWDLLARVGTPFGDSGFRGDLKGGAAYEFTTKHRHNGNDHHKVIPAAGASLAYSFCQNVMVDLSYLHGFGSNSHHHHSNSETDTDSHGIGHSVKSTDLVTIGVSYLFPIM